jgi:hypothetical protein
MHTKDPYDKRRQRNPGMNPKTHLTNPSSHRIPIVSKPCMQPNEQFSKDENLTSQPRTETFRQKPTAAEDSEQKVSIVVENPFDCLASFYFPEHADNNKSINSHMEVKTFESDDNMDTFPVNENCVVHKAEEEFNIVSENAFAQNQVSNTLDNLLSQSNHNLNLTQLQPELG